MSIKITEQNFDTEVLQSAMPVENRAERTTSNLSV